MLVIVKLVKRLLFVRRGKGIRKMIIEIRNSQIPSASSEERGHSRHKQAEQQKVRMTNVANVGIFRNK